MRVRNLVVGVAMTVALGLGVRSSLAFAEDPIAWRQAPWASDLDLEIGRVKRSFSGSIAIYASDPDHGVRYGHNAGQSSYLASGVKIAFMVEVFRQAHRGELSLDEEVVYGPEHIRDGAPIVNKKPQGARFKIRELLSWMMQSSDNAASDMLASRVGLDKINEGLREQGFDGFTPLVALIDVRRGVFRELDVHADDLTPLEIRTIRWTPVWDPQVNKLTELLGKPRGTYKKQDLLDAYERFYATGVNRARLDTVGAILEAMWRGQLVSPDASRQMLELMSHAKTSQRRILGRLPKGTRVAHKTGSQWERICDLGIIYLPDDRPLVLAACLAGGNDRIGAEEALARVARKAYDLVLAEHKNAERIEKPQAP